MPSPFPGMDPYLETHWHAVHAILIAETWRALNRSLPADLSASVEERVSIDSAEEELLAGPDVFVYHPSPDSSDTSSAGTVTIDAPYKMVVDLQPKVQRSVRVINQDGQLITVIEFISPTNKREPGLNTYLKKRNDLIEAGVHVVEIDLVRAGDWRALFYPHVCVAKAESIYRVTVRTAKEHLAPAYVYPIQLDERLPDIQIPLRPRDPKLMLSLQPMIQSIYDDGRYRQTLDYSRDLHPPLSPDEYAYARFLIKAGG